MSSSMCTIVIGWLVTGTSCLEKIRTHTCLVKQISFFFFCSNVFDVAVYGIWCWKKKTILKYLKRQNKKSTKDDGRFKNAKNVSKAIVNRKGHLEMVLKLNNALNSILNLILISNWIFPIQFMSNQWILLYPLI